MIQKTLFFLILIGLSLTGSSQETKPAVEIPAEPIYEVGAIDVGPQFPGGEDKLYEYLTTSLNYPLEEKQKGIEGKVYVQFVVERDGSVSNVVVARSVPDAPGLSSEAIRVVKAMPTWIPGQQSGNTVRSKVLLPVSFELE